MVRKLVVVFTSVVMFAAAHVKALGLGEIVLESSLNQPFSAQIALLQLGDVRPEQIQVQIADERDFARFSIDRDNFLNAIQFDVQVQGDATFVRLTTDELVREPYLSFVLETRWPSGRLLNEYTVLLDLPGVANAGNAAAIQQAVQTGAASQQISQNQTSTAVSSSSSSGASGRFAAPAEPAVTTRDANNSDTITIDSSDTLWDVALQVRPDSSVSVQQTMLALQSLNREAFIGDNINMVRRGQVLRVPTLEQIRALSAREAMSEVARQNQLFENRRNVPLVAQPVTAQPQGNTGAAPNRGELSVVSVDNAEPSSAQAASDSQNAELDARIASLEDALAVQREESDRADLVNAELTARLGLLEEQIASAQEIIRLRDLELAQLQEALAQAPEEPVAEEVIDPPTVITMAPEKSLIEQIIDTLVANTLALVALIGLMILMLVLVLLRRNRAAEQAALADIDAMPVDASPEDQPDDDESTNFTDDSNMKADANIEEMDELFNIADDAEEEGDVEAEEDLDAIADTDEIEEVKDVLDEVDALIAYEKIDEAEVMLRNAIVVQPDRADIRMKMLEVLVAKQDAIGFKLQETEIRDMDVKGLEPRIAALRAQFNHALESEILEDGEEGFFNELNELDDMEVALDLEASAEVDDNKVLSGQVDAADDNAIELGELDTEPSENLAADDEAVLSSEFDLSDEDAPVQPQPLSDDVVEQDIDDNAIDFDFVIEELDAPSDKVQELAAERESGQEEDSSNEIDFDFVVSDEFKDDDVEIEFLDNDDEDQDDIAFDDASFDLSIDDELSAEKPATAGAAAKEGDDPLDDLQFVDDSLDINTDKDDEESDDDLDFLSDADEAATKLDLARAYFEMGDIDGAREILEEVLNEGNEEQVKDAKELIGKL